MILLFPEHYLKANREEFLDYSGYRLPTAIDTKTPMSHIEENAKITTSFKGRSLSTLEKIATHLKETGNKIDAAYAAEQDDPTPVPDVSYDNMQAPELFEKPTLLLLPNGCGTGRS